MDSGKTGTFFSENNPNFIDPSAKIGGNFTCGQFCVIERNAEIGSDVSLGHNVVIKEGTKIGNSVVIQDYSVIGKQPLRSKRSIFKTDKVYKPAVIGNECLIGAHAVVYTGTELANNVLVADSAQVRVYHHRQMLHRGEPLHHREEVQAGNEQLHHRILRAGRFLLHRAGCDNNQ